VAEDNLPDALLIREVVRIEKLPFEVHVAPDGELAVAFIEKAEAEPGAPAPDLLLLDLNLPKKDGYEVLKRLRASAKFGAVPVVIATSSDAPEDRQRASEMGAVFFRKPASYGEFLKLGEVLKQTLAGRKTIPNPDPLK